MEGLILKSVRKDSDGNLVFLLYETISTFSYETPDPQFLSSAGQQLISYLILKKRTIISSFHKIILSKDNDMRVMLIDPSTLLRNETAAEKAMSCIRLISSLYNGVIPIAKEKIKTVFFFSAIQQLYNDNNVGTVTEGYFSTSTGSMFTNNSKGRNSDLRTDPFQQGGEQADPGQLSFTKIRIEWPSLLGYPRAYLNGSSEMFFKPNKSLSDIRVTFSTENGGKAQFLEPILRYATW